LLAQCQFLIEKLPLVVEALKNDLLGLFSSGRAAKKQGRGFGFSHKSAK
jgi:hypothetical protein